MNENYRIILEDSEKIIDTIDTSKIKNKNILIFGGNSFLVSYIQSTIYLLNKNKNYKTKVLSISKNRPNKFLQFLLNEDSNFKFKITNLANYSQNDFSKIVNKKFDYIFLCATYGQPKKWMKNQLETIFLNINLLKDVFNVKKFRDSTFIFFSSADIYGNALANDLMPVSENFSGSIQPSAARSIYGMSKRMGEALCHYYRNYFKMKIYIIRAAHTYGPGMGMKDTRVIIDFFKKAKKGSINLLDQGKSIKTYGYISDIAEMFFNIIQFGKNHTYNTCGNDYINILTLAKKIKKLFKNCKVIKPKNKTSNSQHISSDPANSLLSSKLYCEEFKKRKFVSIEEGLKKLKDYLNL